MEKVYKKSDAEVFKRNANDLLFPSNLKYVIDQFKNKTGRSGISGVPYVVLCLLCAQAMSNLFSGYSGHSYNSNNFLYEAIGCYSMRGGEVREDRYKELVDCVKELQETNTEFFQMLDKFLI